MRRTCITLGILTLGFLMIAAPSPANADTVLIDQTNLPPWDGGWTNIQPGNEVTQTFMPGLPSLLGIDIDILTGNPRKGGDTITVEIARPDETLASVAEFVPEGFDGLLHLDLPSPIDVIPGETLRLVAYDTGKIVFGWKYAGNTYPDGTAFFNGVPQSRDYFFQTYGVPEPATAMLLGFGSVVLTRIRRKSRKTAIVT